MDGDFAQIDHLLIHRVQRSAWVLETKNYSGRLSCDEHGDWTAWRGGKPTSMPSPVNQARRQCETLRQWLEVNGIKPMNKIVPVVLISPTSSVNRTKLPPNSYVDKSDNFIEWWQKQTDAIGIGTALSMVSRHLLSGMSQDDFVALSEQLARAHVPATFDWRSRLRLPSSDVPVAKPSPKPHESSPVSPERPKGEYPLTITTPHGVITITRIPGGRLALRNDKNDALIGLVKNACRGKAQWNGRFRNWLIDDKELPAILASLNYQPDSSTKG